MPSVATNAAIVTDGDGRTGVRRRGSQENSMLRGKTLPKGAWWCPTEGDTTRVLEFEELLDLSRVVLDPRALADPPGQGR